MKIATTMKNILLLITLLLAACSNPYYDFYRGKQYERQFSCEYLGSIASTAEIQNFLNSGYSIIGESAFSSTANHYSVDKMITTCKKVGADAAISNNVLSLNDAMKKNLVIDFLRGISLEHPLNPLNRSAGTCFNVSSV